MAECNLATLLADACSNNFMCAAQTPPVAKALELQLLKLIAQDQSTYEELLAQACTNGFMCAATMPPLAKALELQLLCNISEA